MTIFSQTERNLRKQEREQQSKQPILARVIAVKERHPEVLDRWESGDASKTNVVNEYERRQYEVDVVARYRAAAPEIDGTKVVGATLRDVPVLAGSFGEIGVPEPNRDLAMVEFLDGFNERKPVVTGFHYHIDEVPPVARRGTWRMQKGEMCFEAYEERDRTAQPDLPEYARLAVQNGQEQVSTAPVEVAIKEKSANADEYTVTITGNDSDDPDVTVDFETGEIQLTDGSGASVTLDGDGAIQATDSSGSSVTLDGTGAIEATDSSGSSFEMDGAGTITLDADTIELDSANNTMTFE